MQLTGPGAWGPPADEAEAVRVLRRAVDLGVNLIDTADSYGPDVAEQLVKRALHPYPEGLVVATKAGWLRPSANQWVAFGRPDYLRQQVEMSLRHLAVDCIDLFQLHRIDRALPLEDQIGELASLRGEGKIREIGLSHVSVSDIEAARRISPIASVQNHYNLTNRSSEDVLAYCEARGIAFIPWYPLARGRLADDLSPLAPFAAERRTTSSALTLAWLLRHSPVMLPIPGTSTVTHLEQNMVAAGLELDDETARHVAGLVAGLPPSQ